MKENGERRKVILFTTLLGAVLNLTSALLKFLVGSLSQSIAIITDGANNLTDVISSVVTFAGYDLGRRKATHHHPLGFGRVEYISALFVSTVIILTGFSFLKSSFLTILNPKKVDISFAFFALILITTIFKIVIWRISVKNGKRINSDALLFSGRDAAADILVTFVTLLGAVSGKFTSLNLDGYAGLIVSLIIIYSGLSSILSTVSTIVGKRPDKKTINQIRYIISKHPPLFGGFDIVIHSYGPERRMGTLSVEVPYDSTAEDVFNAIVDAEEEIMDEMNIYMVIAPVAVNSSNPKVVEMKEKVLLTMKNTSEAVIDIHGFHIHFDSLMVHFDVVVDFSIDDYSSFREKITDALKKEFPSYSFKFNIDPDYS